MNNVFIDLVLNKNKFTYECNGKEIPYTDEPVEHEKGKYLVVLCDKCCNVPVYHLLTKSK